MTTTTRGQSDVKVALDRDLCIGCSLCTELCRQVFVFDFDESLAYVRDGTGRVETVESSSFPNEFADRVSRAANECPAECIFVETGEEHPSGEVGS
jgi:ferredoxin